MNTKDEVFIWFHEFKARVENHIGNKFKVLRSDNGGEYTSNDFKDFYKEVGIKRECLTTPIFQQRMNTFSNHSHNQIKYQHTNVFMW
jgi:Ca2+-binding EF-hand superfamily protein